MDKIANRALTAGVCNKLYNDQVQQRYSDNQTLLDVCTIYPFNSHLEILDKKLTFYFVLENYTPQIEERVRIRGKKDKSDLPTTWMKVHIKFKERYIKSDTGETKALGQRRITVNNIDESKIDADKMIAVFSGKSFIFGSNYVTYNFKNGKEIVLKHIESEAVGIELIRTFLDYTVESTHMDGKFEGNILTVNAPKNAPKPETDGLRGHIYKLTFHKRDGKRTNQIARILIPNKVK